MNRRALALPLLTALAALAPAGARADKIKHTTAVFEGLDKITGRVISFEVATDETVQFGSLQITPRVCYTRPPTEAPQTDSFIEVDEVETNNQYKRIFTGWMFAASPGLHGIEHPVYDVWLTDCKGGSQLVAEAVAAPEDTILAAPQKPATAPAPPPKKPRPPAPAAQPTIVAAPLPAPAPAPTPHRSPIQSFFPTAANPGESVREKELSR